MPRRTEQGFRMHCEPAAQPGRSDEPDTLRFGGDDDDARLATPGSRIGTGPVGTRVDAASHTGRSAGHPGRLGTLRPVGDSVRQWNGDSRGRWEGNTLVVEVTNYNDKGAIATNIATRGARGLPRSEALHVVERFTFADANTINYEVTIEDPDVYSASWTVAIPLNKDTTYDLFEYACHEGNYGLENSLSAGRAEDRAAK